jgi:thiosulfate dehydrogenase [quinone] large subunit
VPPTWWALVPLRLFLGVTFTYAGLQKLADHAYLDGSSPLSVQSMIRALQHQSPIGFLLGWSAHAPVLVGVLIALGELAVGLGTLLGLWVRVTSLGGMFLALTFFLTVSWRTRPYYYGSDIVFIAAWSVPLLLGSWGGPTADALIRRRAARDADPRRRQLILGAATTGALAVFTGSLAAAVAAVGRSRHRAGTTAVPTPAAVPTTADPSVSDSPQPTTSPAGRTIARAADVPSGSAVSFTDDSGQPAILIHEPAGGFRAFNAVCTHAGCTVQYDANAGLVCPCHGGRYDATTGAVVAGPPPSPLSKLHIRTEGGKVELL